MSVVLAAALLALSACCVARRSAGVLRVHAGQPDTHHEFPFIVMFQTRVQPLVRACTGSLLSPNWVLTAAHCLSDSKNRIIKYGDFNLLPNDTRLYTNIIKAFKHPASTVINLGNRETYSSRNDIGLVLVEKILNKPTARLLALDYKSLIGLPVKYAGFGVISKKLEYKFPEILTVLSDLQFPPRVGEGVIGPCNGFLNNNVGPILCIFAKCSNRKHGPRAADSGGPLVFHGRVIGVTMGGNYDNIFYTPVSIYLQWIQEVMRSN